MEAPYLKDFDNAMSVVYYREFMDGHDYFTCDKSPAECAKCKRERWLKLPIGERIVMSDGHPGLKPYVYSLRRGTWEGGGGCGTGGRGGGRSEAKEMVIQWLSKEEHKNAHQFGHFLDPDKYNLPYPRRVIYNGPATIILWSDNTKTVAKIDSKDHTFNYLTGYAMAYAKKFGKKDFFEGMAKAERAFTEYYEKEKGKKK